MAMRHRWRSLNSSTAMWRPRAWIPARWSRPPPATRHRPKTPEFGAFAAAMAHLRSVLLLILASALSCFGASAFAQSVPNSRTEIAYSFATIVKQAAPAVVNIYTRRVVENQPASPFFNDPFFQQFFGPDFNFGVPQERVQNSLGSGVILR